jgi:hypothetical protein
MHRRFYFTPSNLEYLVDEGYCTKQLASRVSEKDVKAVLCNVNFFLQSYNDLRKYRMRNLTDTLSSAFVTARQGTSSILIP